MKEWLCFNKIYLHNHQAIVCQFPVKGCRCEPWMVSEFLVSRGENFDLGPETRLDHSGLLGSKILLKYKWDRESFWHRLQKGVENIPPCQFLARHLILVSKLLIIDKRNISNLRELHQVSLPQHTNLQKGSGLQMRCLWARYIVYLKQLTCLEGKQICKQDT